MNAMINSCFRWVEEKAKKEKTCKFQSEFDSPAPGLGMCSGNPSPLKRFEGGGKKRKGGKG